MKRLYATMAAVAFALSLGITTASAEPYTPSDFTNDVTGAITLAGHHGRHSCHHRCNEHYQSQVNWCDSHTSGHHHRRHCVERAEHKFEMCKAHCD